MTNIDLGKVTVTFGACSFATICYIFRHKKLSGWKHSLEIMSFSQPNVFPMSTALEYWQHSYDLTSSDNACSVVLLPI